MANARAGMDCVNGEIRYTLKRVRVLQVQRSSDRESGNEQTTGASMDRQAIGRRDSTGMRDETAKKICRNAYDARMRNAECRMRPGWMGLTSFQKL